MYILSDNIMHNKKGRRVTIVVGFIRRSYSDCEKDSDELDGIRRD
jgi:hypothetical protein